MKQNKINELKEHVAMLYKENKERVEEFVSDILGDDFKVKGFTPSGFGIVQIKDNKEVFGGGFEVYIRDDWHYDANHKFIRTPRVEVNIGTCGSFEIGAENEQEKKYMAFARFMSQSRECCLDKSLIMYHEALRTINRELDKLEEE